MEYVGTAGSSVKTFQPRVGHSRMIPETKQAYFDTNPYMYTVLEGYFRTRLLDMGRRPSPEISPRIASNIVPSDYFPPVSPK